MMNHVKKAKIIDIQINPVLLLIHNTSAVPFVVIQVPWTVR